MHSQKLIFGLLQITAKNAKKNYHFPCKYVTIRKDKNKYVIRPVLKRNHAGMWA